MGKILRPLYLAGLAVSCTPLPPLLPSAAGTVAVPTNGDLTFGEARAKLACGEPKRTPGLLSVTVVDGQQVAIYRCI